MILNPLQHDNEGGEMNLRLSQSMPGTHTLSRKRFYLDSDILILIPNKFILIPRNWSWHGLCGELLLPRGSYSFLPPSWAFCESSLALLWKCLGTYFPGDEQPIPSYLLPGNFKYRAVGDPIFFCAPGDLRKYLETRILFDGTSSNEWVTPLPIWKEWLKGRMVPEEDSILEENWFPARGTVQAKMYGNTREAPNSCIPCRARCMLVVAEFQCVVKENSFAKAMFRKQSSFFAPGDDWSWGNAMAKLFPKSIHYAIPGNFC